MDIENWFCMVVKGRYCWSGSWRPSAATTGPETKNVQVKETLK